MQCNYATVYPERASLTGHHLRPPIFSQTPVAASITTDRTAATIAHVIVRLASSSWLWHLRRDLAELLIEATLNTLGAVASTARAITTGGRVAVVPSTSANGNWQALDNAIGHPLAGSLSGVHSVIGGEVPADHERFHSCAVLGQLRCLVGDIGGVLPAIHCNLAIKAVAVAIRFVMRVGPLTALANTGQVHSVEHVDSNKLC